MMNNDDIFFQFYNYRANDFIELNNENRHAANIFIFLCSRMDKTNAVTCSIQFLMKHFNISRTATYSAIKALKDSEFLIVFTTDKIFTFAINSDITWKSTDLGRDKNAYVFNKVKKSLPNKTKLASKQADIEKAKDDSIDEWIDDLNAAVINKEE